MIDDLPQPESELRAADKLTWGTDNSYNLIIGYINRHSLQNLNVFFARVVEFGILYLDDTLSLNSPDAVLFHHDFRRLDDQLCDFVGRTLDLSNRLKLVGHFAKVVNNLLHVKQISHSRTNWNVFCDEVLADNEENASECSLLEYFVSEHEPTPHHAFHFAYVVNVLVLFLKTSNWSLLICEGFYGANVCKCLLSDCHHLPLWFLVGFIVFPVEAHENSIAEYTWGDE